MIRFVGASPPSRLPPPSPHTRRARRRASSSSTSALEMLAGPAALHLLLPAPPPHRRHLAFALPPHPAPPLHARAACSRRPRRRALPQRHGVARASAAVAEEASSSGPAKFSVRIPVGDREVSADELQVSPRPLYCGAVLCPGVANRSGCVAVRPCAVHCGTRSCWVRTCNSECGFTPFVIKSEEHQQCLVVRPCQLHRHIEVFCCSSSWVSVD